MKRPHRPTLRITPTLCLALALCWTPAHAGPVQGEAIGLAKEPADAAALPSLLPAVPSAEGTAAETAAPQPYPVRPSGPISLTAESEAGSSGSALAAEILREAGAGAAAESGDPRRQAATARRPAGNPGEEPEQSEFERGLRDFGKATVLWLKDTVPWLRGDDDESGHAGTGPRTPGTWSEGSFEASEGQRVASPREPAPGSSEHGRAQYASSGSSGYIEQPRYEMSAVENNLVREAIRTLQEVLGHPMTWLVISLFVIGGIAVSLADRRPK